MTSAAALKRRWTTPTGRSSAADILRRLQTGEALGDLGLDTVDARVDLRGITFGARYLRFTGVRLTGLDLSHADVSLVELTGCQLDDCRFERAVCRDWKVFATDVTDCSFAGANLRDSSLGYWHGGRGSVYERVSFVGAKLIDASTLTAVYRDCDFSSAQLQKVNFWQSSLIRCRFAGPVKDVIFDGRVLGEPKPDPNPMEDVDFTDARLENCTFRGVRFDRVRLPKDPDLVLIPDVAMYDRVIALAQANLEPEPARFAATFLDLSRRTKPPGSATLLNLRDLAPYGAEIGEILVMAGGVRQG
ncbi:pentapeptide repeat-containing protein [Dactylosporangium sp. NPDC050588]|uniref:pentapeptide repeat-containing protein n=1 Tax=Dactylosporangium sp. NPDC050588 TaxID=3157211 RepID=UPI0033DFDC1F